MRPLTYIPPGGAVVETCTRTLQGRLLLRPGPDANEIMLGALGRAVEYAKVDLFGFAFASNHYHLLMRVESGLQMARFHCHLNSNLARELGRLHGWRDKFWSRPYRHMVISDEPEAQLARLRYLLANNTKEGLVASPLDWPGPNMARAVLREETLAGYWFNRTKEWAARRRGEDFGKYNYATKYEIELQQPRAFADLPKEEYREIIAALVRDIEEDTAAERAERPALGPEILLAKDPHEAPRKPKKSSAPMLFFARSMDLLAEMKEGFRRFVADYRTAADRLLEAQRKGGAFDPRREFPEGSFPPALQFVGATFPAALPSPPSRRLDYSERGPGQVGPKRIVGRGEIPIVKIPRTRTIAASEALSGQKPTAAREGPG